MVATITAIAIILAATSTATTVYAQKKQASALEEQGKAQQRSAESQSELSTYNAEVADLQAQDALDRGVEEESRFRASIRGTIGSQRAGAAAGNVDVNYGSPVDVQADAAFLGELDALTIKTNAAREAWGYQVQGADLRQRAAIEKKEGTAYAAAGASQASAARWQAAGSLLGGGASLLQASYGFGRTAPARGGTVTVPYAGYGVYR